MIEIDQSTFNMIFSIVCGGLGWALRSLFQADRELAEKVAEIDKLVAGKYVSIERFDNTVRALFERFDKMENRRDELSLKMEAMFNKLDKISDNLHNKSQ